MLEQIGHKRTALALRERWENLPATGKLGLVAVLCLLVAGTVSTSLFLRHRSMRPLFAALPPAEADMVIKKLDAMGQPYQLATDGSTILVNSGSVARLRLELAAAGLPAGATPGFALLDKSSLTRSDFAERVAYQRALQGELETTIDSIPQVREARVHLNVPRRPLFLNDKQDSSAAVFLELVPGSRLNRNQVLGIVNLVAASVPGLTPQGVTVMDSTGSLNVRGDQLQQGGFPGGGADQRSHTLTRAAQAILDRVLGPGRGLATVRVEVDDRSSRTERDAVEPGPGGKVLPVHTQQTVETFHGTRPVLAGKATPGVPAVQTVPGLPPGQQPSYTQRSSKTDYELTKVHQVTHDAAGRISRITASVVVDKGAGLSAKELASLGDEVKAAIGSEASRGDRVEVRAIPFNHDEAREMKKEIAAQDAADRRQRRLELYVLGGLAAAGLLLLVGFLLLVLVRSRRRARDAGWVDVDVEDARAQPRRLKAGGGVDLRLPAEDPEAGESPEAAVDELLVQAMQAAEREPGMVARLLERWVQLDDR